MKRILTAIALISLATAGACQRENETTDKRLDALESALNAGIDTETHEPTAADRTVAVAAAKALGSGPALGIASPEAESRARVGNVQVSLHVHLGDLLRPASRVVDVPADDVDAFLDDAEPLDALDAPSVASTQPIRSVTSSRATRAQRGR